MADFTRTEIIEDTTIIGNGILPYNDKFMTYDDEKHRYTLTIKAVDDEFNTSFSVFAGSTEDADALLSEISGDIYKYIYKYNRRNEDKRRKTEYLLAKNQDFRFVLKETMLDYVRATIRSGYVMIKDLSPVNTETGVVMDFSNLPGIAPDSIDGLLANRLLYRGNYSWVLPNDEYRKDY